MLIDFRGDNRRQRKAFRLSLVLHCSAVSAFADDPEDPICTCARPPSPLLFTCRLLHETRPHLPVLHAVRRFILDELCRIAPFSTFIISKYSYRRTVVKRLPSCGLTSLSQAIIDDEHISTLLECAPGNVLSNKDIHVAITPPYRLWIDVLLENPSSQYRIYSLRGL